MEKCLFQHIRPSNDKINIKIPGFGNCNTCKYDLTNNKKCKGYQEIEICLNIIKIK